MYKFSTTEMVKLYSSKKKILNSKSVKVDPGPLRVWNVRLTFVFISFLIYLGAYFNACDRCTNN